MKRYLSTLAPLSLFAAASSAWATPSAIRYSYNAKSLDRETIEVDLVNACVGKTSCKVPVGDGTLSLSAPGVAKFSGLNPAEGVISDKVESALKDQRTGEMTLPANGCINAGNYKIEAFAWKADVTYKDRGLTGWDDTSQAFTETVRSLDPWAVYRFDPSNQPSQFCIHPKDGTPFSVLWVRVNGTTTSTKGDIDFSTNMKRASNILLNDLNMAIGEATALTDPDVISEILYKRDHPNGDGDGDLTPGEQALVDESVRRTKLLISTLQYATREIDPGKTGSAASVSVAQPRVLRAIKSVVDTWSYVSDAINSLAIKGNTTKLDSKSVAVAVDTNSFQRNMDWLRADIESLKVFPVEGKGTSATVAYSEMLINQLARMRASFGDAALPALEELQTRLVAVERAARGKDDIASDSTTTQAVADFAAAWNGEAAQRMISKAQLATSTQADALFFRQLLGGVRGLPSARGLELKQAGGNGPALAGSYRCDVDQKSQDKGQYCVIDLISECLGRTSCSVSFGSHYVTSISKMTSTSLRPDRGWAGERVVMGYELPANNEVCSDLDITGVKYQPMNESTRWTKVRNGGVITGHLENYASVIKKAEYPTRLNQNLSTKCVRLDSEIAEPDYAILSVRVAARLDTDRVGQLKDLMLKAGERLVEKLRYTQHESQNYRKLYASDPNDPRLKAFDAYLSAVGMAIATLDKTRWDFKKTNTPVTSQLVIERMRKAYVLGKYLISVLRKDGNRSIGPVAHLMDMIAEINQGFGFNEIDSNETRIDRSETSAADLIEFQKGLKANISNIGNWGVQAPRYGQRIREYGAALSNLDAALKQLDQAVDPSKTGMFFLDDHTSAAAAALLAQCAGPNGLLTKLGNNSLYTDLVAAVQPLCDSIPKAFRLKAVDDTSGAAQDVIANLTSTDANKRLEPLFEILTMALGQSSRDFGLSWDDPRWKAAVKLQNEVAKLLKAAKNGDTSAMNEMADFTKQWSSPEFQSLLELIVERSEDQTSVGYDSARASRDFVIGSTAGMKDFFAEKNPSVASALSLPDGFDNRQAH